MLRSIVDIMRIESVCWLKTVNFSFVDISTWAGFKRDEKNEKILTEKSRIPLYFERFWSPARCTPLSSFNSKATKQRTCLGIGFRTDLVDKSHMSGRFWFFWGRKHRNAFRLSKRYCIDYTVQISAGGVKSFSVFVNTLFSWWYTTSGTASSMIFFCHQREADSPHAREGFVSSCAHTGQPFLYSFVLKKPIQTVHRMKQTKYFPSEFINPRTPERVADDVTDKTDKCRIK